MGGLSFDIALVFIPGLICTKLYMTLTSFRKPGYVEVAGYSLVFGFICYVLWSLVVKGAGLLLEIPAISLYLEDPSAVTRLISEKHPIRSTDIIGASVFALILALVLSYTKRTRLFFRFTESIGASHRFSTDSVFVAFSTLAQNQYVRIWKKADTAYEGTIHLFYEHEDMYEIVLADVEIVSIDSPNADKPEVNVFNDAQSSSAKISAPSNPIAYLYVRWNKSDDVLIEQPTVNEPVTTATRSLYRRAKDYFGSSAAGTAKFTGASRVGAGTPASAVNKTASTDSET